MKQIDSVHFRIESIGDMRVPVDIYADKDMLHAMEADKAIMQASNVATLPGIERTSIMLPDAHQGYGFPIGGVAAFDYDDGLITPGGIGFDINCGVRLLRTPLNINTFSSSLNQLHNRLFREIPVGLGPKSRISLEKSDLNKVLTEGASWAIRNGFGFDADLEYIEEDGCMKGAEIGNVSERAKERGLHQLGTLGAGNHFIEVQRVETIYDKDTASSFGIDDIDQLMICMHTGSRGLGHEVCTDYLMRFQRSGRKIELPDRNLIYAGSRTDLAKDYFSAMKASANFAWANRQVITHLIRQVFTEFGLKQHDIGIVYDIAHNIAKVETYHGRRYYVHRKGATRAFPAGHPEIKGRFKSTGHPVLIPGSMGTASYVMVGLDRALEETFGSCAHGAGRLLSRTAAKKQIKPQMLLSELKSKGIGLKAPSIEGTTDEAPEAYKDIEHVIDVCIRAGLVRKVARLVPVLVIKG